MKLIRPLVILDLETTGTWKEKDKVVEIGMVKCQPDGSIERFAKRVNPGIPIPKDVSRIHSITDEDVKNAPTFRKIASDVLSFIETSDLGGFNIEQFDLPLLEREFFEAGLKFDWQHRNIYDARRIYHFHEKRDLTAAYQFYCNKELKSAHSALDDAEATLEILKSQISRYATPDQSIETLKNFEEARKANYFDEERKFRWWNKELYPTFGKFARKCSLKEIAQKEPSYLEWILNQDFSDKIKSMIKNVLNGQFPRCPDS